MNNITPFLWFDDNLEEAVNFYTSVFKNATIGNISKNNGKVFSATFNLEGQEFYGLNGGPHFNFNEAISFFVNCEDQKEVDYYWEKLTENGGQESRCGWLKDKFGLSWQIIPKALGEMMGDKNPVKAKNVMQAMMQMGKIEVSLLEQARDKE